MDEVLAELRGLFPDFDVLAPQLRALKRSFATRGETFDAMTRDFVRFSPTFAGTPPHIARARVAIGS